MIAASYWSLLNLAIEIATDSQNYGSDGEYAILPVVFGFLLGAFFVYLADAHCHLPSLTKKLPQIIVTKEVHYDSRKNGLKKKSLDPINEEEPLHFSNSDTRDDNVRKRQLLKQKIDSTPSIEQLLLHDKAFQVRWKRILMLIIAMTVHNIPEGLAVGVGFGAINKTKSATFTSARNLAIGIGIQNFPEGLAVSLPLHAAGFSKWKSFWYGQLSGLVEPIAGLLGYFTVTVAEPLLPYSLSFAAGAMIYVVVDDIIPEAQVNGNGKLASLFTIIGFAVMMILDVSLG